MKKYLQLWICALAFVQAWANVFAQQTGVFERTIAFRGGARNVAFYVPENYDPKSKYPVIIGMHGGGSTGEEMRETMRPMATYLQSILVCPDDPNNDGKIIPEVIDSLKAEYSLDAKKIILTGYSFGGGTALNYGLKNGDKFAGIVAFAPVVSSYASLNYSATKELPVCIIVGSKDDFIDITREIKQRILNAGGKLKYIEKEGVEHMDHYYESFTFENDWQECYNYILRNQPKEKFEIPAGKPILIDGGFSAAEWSDAASIIIKLKSGTNITVYCKHDNENFNFAFCPDKKDAPAMNFPEILLDMKNDKSSAWMTDDWWFHVSATDCYSKGKYGDYTTCLAEQKDWKANNFTDNDFRDTVEITIPFTTIGLEKKDSIAFGICLEVTNTQDRWEYWPAASDKSKPSGWAQAIVRLSDAGADERETLSNFILFPNPAADYVALNWRKDEPTTVTIYNANGVPVLVTQNPGRIELRSLPEGVYFLKAESSNEIITRGFVISR